MAGITWNKKEWSYDSIVVKGSVKHLDGVIGVKKGVDGVIYGEPNCSNTITIKTQDVEGIVFKEAKLLSSGRITILCKDFSSYMISFKKTPDEFYVLCSVLENNGVKVQKY